MLKLLRDEILWIIGAWTAMGLIGLIIISSQGF